MAKKKNPPSSTRAKKSEPKPKGLTVEIYPEEEDETERIEPKPQIPQKPLEELNWEEIELVPEEVPPEPETEIIIDLSVPSPPAKPSPTPREVIDRELLAIGRKLADLLIKKVNYLTDEKHANYSRVKIIFALCALNDMPLWVFLNPDVLKGAARRFSKFRKLSYNIVQEKLNKYVMLSKKWEPVIELEEDSPVAKRVIRASLVGKMLATIPDGLKFEEEARACGDINHAFRAKLAEHLQPKLNATIQSMPQDTLEQKKAICDFLTATLEPLGLAVECPNTKGLPGTLKATSGHWPGVGRFHFEVYIDGKRKIPSYSDTLPLLKLVDSNVASELERHWQNKIGTKSDRTGRKVTD